MSGGRCAGCGGVLGRDCWNEADCVWISRDMASRSPAMPEPDLCQGCSEVTGAIRACIGVCEGMDSEHDLALRARLWLELIHARAT